MIGYLVYHPKEAEKNQAFIRLFEEEGKKESIFFSYVSHEQYQSEPLPDFVLNRTRSPQVSMWYEKRHIPVFHSAFLTELGNHKRKKSSVRNGRRIPYFYLRNKLMAVSGV